MNRGTGMFLLACGITLAGLAAVIHNTGPENARPTVLAGMAGAALCVLWGTLVLLGNGRKAWTILSLIPVGFVLLSQAVSAWLGEGGFAGRHLVAGLVTLALATSVGALMRAAYDGAFPSVSPPGTGQLPPQGAGPKEDRTASRRPTR